jgi:hypothetical protein
MPENEDLEVKPDAPKVNSLAPIAVMIGLFASIFRAYVWAHGNMNGEAIGYAFGGMLLSFLIAYLLAGRRKVRNRNRFSAIFFGVSMFGLLLELGSKH